MSSPVQKWMCILGASCTLVACATTTPPKTKEELIQNRISYLAECAEDAEYDRAVLERCKTEAEEKYVIPVVSGRKVAAECKAEVEKTTTLSDSMSDADKDTFVKEWFACMEEVNKYKFLSRD